MRQTLFHIPHAIEGVPVFGFGWALLIWGVFAAGLLLYLTLRQGFGAKTRSVLPMLGFVALAIAVLLPMLEERITLTDGHEAILGLPIRGYGTVVLFAFLIGMAVAVHQWRRAGLDPEALYSMAFWMFVSAVVGARTFFVVQKWDQFAASTWYESLGKIVNVTMGGLVVYGALIGALLAGTVFVVRHGLPALAVADLIAPSLVLGLAVGRLGCLMNGCCYGGVCHLPWSISFPQRASRFTNVESPPYEHQHRLGLLHGIQLATDANGYPVVGQIVDKQGPAARAGLRAGDRIASINRTPVVSLDEAMAVMARTGPEVTLEITDGRFIRWSIGELPAWSRPVHPTQVYSSLNAAVLFLFLFAYYPFRRRDGEVFALLLTIYPLTRFLLEIIRTDEGAIFGTAMTVSQNVSILILLAIAALWVYVLRQPRGFALPMPPASS